ncbi:histone-lysine N-methyltransferase SUVR4 isoform X1 [Arachis ipaensis]|uniref:histone-lysine N-methyltransferase SUVR4 isoform X1 n=1 Tax=Arachis ipaensis TaxID=130454 RepID=UPI000A2B3EC1|nr:histone-lysine N-methyltransferase SUVR4 isoform X1 [Arachis ipaensis]XP_020971315.1 histone-lysine N-methyltransferase SUVR4 isoform X1 [Arachis ipaensis]XP_025632549.1 histone-lysine N-methyltransferase SUVR4 isoform X1 [Arachis hypogaea]
MAPPNANVKAAYRAMAGLGISESQVKPVLKKLLKLYDKNWALIEEENYRALADAIFEPDDENQVPDQKRVPEQKKKKKKVNEEEMENEEEAEMNLESARPLKRVRLRGQESQSLHPTASCSPTLATSPSKQSDTSGGNLRTEVHPAPTQDVIVGKGKQPVSPDLNPRRRRLISESERASQSVPSKDPTAKPVIPPELSSVGGSSMNKNAAGKQNGHVNMASSQCTAGDSNERATSSIEIASSTKGEVKISLSCSSAVGGPDFHMPSQDQILKMMEDKCLHSYKITDPNFSVPKLLKDICDCVLEFKIYSDGSQEGALIRSRDDMLKESETHGTLSVTRNKDLDVLSLPPSGTIHVESSATLPSPRNPFSLANHTGQVDAVLVSRDAIHHLSENDDGMELEDPTSSNSRSLVVVPQHELTADDIRSIHDVNDLTKAEESVQISWVNEVTKDFLPPFHYIPQNLVFQNASVNILLSRIGDEDCCSSCVGNCVSSPTPCACANKNGGEFAYNARGLLKEGFLEGCIAISRNPKRYYVFCKDCPIERSKNDDCLEPCKGHLKRKFIKECWSKCGCGKQCGNRIVQRGITCNLQVFFTPEGKGWGLRTLEELPKGAFVCEFVGEILTIKELHERNMKHAVTGEYTYPVLLDADWGSRFVKDEEALSLDAASFGNAARFINHRCYDSNLVEIPVEIEVPGHYYYHFALFTCRKVAAKEELTWDYGIDFDDHDNPIKPFQCKCGSKFCRNMKRSNRSVRSSPSNARCSL